MTSFDLDCWFLENKRDFPWRESITPYRVWVSEVMLQQTRAQVVIDYFERWMAVFPDLATLAAAPIEQVIKMWEGLGYYSRARNLHAGARQIKQQFDGIFPSTPEDLLKIRGLGPYTVAAILSFAFHQRAVAIDGNVLRVIARYAWIGEDILKVATKRKITAFVEPFLSKEQPWVTMEALIELGATVCTPKPRCAVCPMQRNCQAYSKGQVDVLPIKSSTLKTEKITRGVAVIESEGFILVRKNGVGQVMADLCEYPYFEGKDSSFSVLQELEKLGIQANFVKNLASVKHSFTRFLATLYPFYFWTEHRLELDGYAWVSAEQLQSMPFSSGHRKIVY